MFLDDHGSIIQQLVSIQIQQGQTTPLSPPPPSPSALVIRKLKPLRNKKPQSPILNPQSPITNHQLSSTNKRKPRRHLRLRAHKVRKITHHQRILETTRERSSLQFFGAHSEGVGEVAAEGFVAWGFAL